MKYISVVILVALLSWTWCLANSERPLRLEQHKHVEAGVEEDIRTFIQRKYPQTTELYCPQLYTEVTAPGEELIARFRCLAIGAAGSEEATEQVFEGFLRLKSTDGFETWGETGGEIHGKEIRFLNGVKISPRDTDDGQDSSGEKPADKKTETKKK